jgi:hypothetical protein
MNTINTDVPNHFTRQEIDAESGLKNFGARMFDSELGIFARSHSLNGNEICDAPASDENG